MNIGIIGLGLIGGSLAKAFKQNTEHTVYGTDISESVIIKAKLFGAIDDDLKDLSICDIIILAIYPEATIEYIRTNGDKFKKGSIVLDCCGVKKVICDKCMPIADKYGFTFIGGHPMAGLEFSGFDHSRKNLFQNASMVLTPDGAVSIQQLELIKLLFVSIGFSKIQISTPEEHDEMIALTSQLAHIISSAYVKSPNALNHKGFSAGSFKDMTRVAKLNENMWTELFLMNKDFLLAEIDGLIERLSMYRDAVRNSDVDELTKLLGEGRERKAAVDGNSRK